jgi:hypothetical protein
MIKSRAASSWHRSTNVFCSVCKQQDITSTMRNEVLSRASGSFGALFLALKLSKMIFTHFSVAGASSSIHGCLFTCGHLHSWYWQSWCQYGAYLNISFVLLFYCVISLLLANQFQFYSCFEELFQVLVISRFCLYWPLFTYKMIISLAICDHFGKAW